MSRSICGQCGCAFDSDGTCGCNPCQKKPHVHAKLIKQWADDTSRVVQYEAAGSWIDVAFPKWDEAHKYRFKPEPPRNMYMEWKAELTQVRHPEHWELPNLRLTFSGEDGKLIKAEVI